MNNTFPTCEARTIDRMCCNALEVTSMGQELCYPMSNPYKAKHSPNALLCFIGKATSIIKSCFKNEE